MENLVLTLMASIGGAGAASYFGSKIALAELRRDMEHQKEDHADLKGRVDRLEAKALAVPAQRARHAPPLLRTALPAPGSGCLRSSAYTRTGSTRPRGAETREDLGDRVASATAGDVSRAVGSEASARHAIEIAR